MTHAARLMVALLAAASTSGGSPLAEDPPLRAVLLFRKPETSTGQLVAVREGLDVLRAQKAPFAIISAVGPTRTGKSSILGRAFLRGAHENLFEIGSGVTSFTGGVWITSRPIELHDSNGKPLRVLLVDTEGFSGVGGLTSRTYEANLFGLIYLMSSAVVFNTMFPVDASTTRMMSGHAAHALRMLKELSDHHVWTLRKPPALVWAVQGFNMFNLRNTGISADGLLSALRNATHASSDGLSGDAAAAVLGSSASSSTDWLVTRIFGDVQLVPVRRPHPQDEVVANLASVPSSKLSAEYLADADALREAVASALVPAHRCTHTPRVAKAGALPRLRAPRCDPAEWDGSEFVTQLEGWLRHGHIIEEADAPSRLYPANATDELAAFDDASTAWLRRQCNGARRALKKALKPLWRNITRHTRARARALHEAQASIEGMAKACLSRAVQQGIFWRQPAAVAAMMEQRAARARVRCDEELVAHMREYEDGLERWWRWLNRRSGIEQRKRRERRERMHTPPPPSPPSPEAEQKPQTSWLGSIFGRGGSAAKPNGENGAVSASAPAPAVSADKSQWAGADSPKTEPEPRGGRRRARRNGRQELASLIASPPPPLIKSDGEVRQGGREVCFTVYD